MFTGVFPMKESTFKKLVVALIDQYKEDSYKAEALEEIFRSETSIVIGNDLLDEVFDVLVEEYNVDDEKTMIAVDIIFNNILAFKYNGNVYEATVDNLYLLFTDNLI